MKSTKKSFLTSLVALLVLFSMFVGTTFAWFTDIAVSSGNVIQAGKLDIVLVKGTHTNNGWNWEDTDGKAIFNYDKWEPGYTTYAALGIENVGNLAAKVTAKISLNGTPTILGDVIEVYAATDFDAFDPSARPDFTDTNAWVSLGTMADILNGRSAVLPERLLEPNTRARMIIALHMKEDAGNEYQGIDLGANFDITVMATQASFESDSFDDQYDVDSEWPYVAVKFHAPKSVADNLVVDPASNKTTLAAPVTLGDANGIKAEINENVELEPGVETLTLRVESMETPTQDIDLQPGEVARSIDVHVDGVKDGNTTPMLITLPELFSAGLNEGNARIIHVEDGQPVEMTRVDSLADLDAHNEFYYDVDTGDVVVAMASFSEITPIENDYNPWNGEVDTSWYDANQTEFTLTTADQIAGFGAIVDGGYNDREGTDKVDNWVSLTQDSFEKKTIKLGADINMDAVDAEGNRISFNPIGYSYSYKGGQVFKGTFDGQNHTISNLYINGWELGLSYSMAGGGFFASVEDATIQNVTFSNAEIVMECIEQGVVAGLAAGNCTFEKINIYGCSVANYQRATGGVVGEVNPYRDNTGKIDESRPVVHNFTDINIDSTTVIGSLWGDFDAPVGGVIGAKWDDSKGVTSVNMTRVNVACRLDVYNDVTSTYQWYSYRRAGMLIGNTEDAVTIDGHTVASADFLTCENVNVYYGDWVDYHYCEFNNHNSSWPFVRVEAGENCTAYSNPRYGVPNDPVTGEPVTSLDHNHTNGDNHNITLTFNQLYGGGQGVYGEDSHAGVALGAYTITYINNGTVLGVKYVTAEEAKSDVSTENATAQALAMEGLDTNKITFRYWMNTGSTKVASIPANNTEDVVLYPAYNNLYTAMFVDQNGNILAWNTFTKDNYSDIKSMGTADLAPIINQFDFDHWEVHSTDANGNTTNHGDLSASSYIANDITIFPIYIYNGAASLVPVDEDGDGDTDFYQVDGYTNGNGSKLVEVPNEVNGIPVTTINAEAFNSYDDLHAVKIPENVTIVSAKSFSDSTWSRQTVTLYYEGTPDQWKSYMDEVAAAKADSSKTSSFATNWDYGMGTGSRVFFLDENDNVDLSKGYWELYADKNLIGIYSNFQWIYHNHSFPYSGSGCNASSTHYQNDTDYDYVDKTTPANSRPDHEYWYDENGVSILDPNVTLN